MTRKRDHHVHVWCLGGGGRTYLCMFRRVCTIHDTIHKMSRQKRFCAVAVMGARPAEVSASSVGLSTVSEGPRVSFDVQPTKTRAVRIVRCGRRCMAARPFENKVPRCYHDGAKCRARWRRASQRCRRHSSHQVGWQRRSLVVDAARPQTFRASRCSCEFRSRDNRPCRGRAGPASPAG
jgi:hypothetical protein